jgi:hypothetical protein
MNNTAYAVYTSGHKLVETFYGDERTANKLAEKLGGYVVTSTY